jgi:phage/plasmid primase-like uncharacterized protein
VPLPLVEALILVDEVLEALARVGDGLDFVVLVNEVTISEIKMNMSRQKRVNQARITPPAFFASPGESNGWQVKGRAHTRELQNLPDSWDPREGW